MIRDMNRDNYEEIINGEDTYRTIAKKLLNEESVLIGWTDEDSTHFDILFTLGAYRPYKNITQFGIRSNNLFISIIRWGAFAFDINNEKSSNYYAEKLFLTNQPENLKNKIAELFNGVIKSLNNGGITND